MAEEKMVKVRNRSDAIVVYSIPELGIRREFARGETKDVALSELTALSYRPGGAYIIQHQLQIKDAETVKAMPIHVEPEYYLDENGVIKLLNGMDNLDEFLDCLDFAPEGVKELVKKYAVELPVNDSRKRAAIKNKLGFDVDLALLHLQQIKDEEEKEKAQAKEETETPVRRVKTPTEETPSRRTTPNYKIVE